MFRPVSVAAIVVASLLVPLLLPATGWAEGQSAASSMAGRQPDTQSPCDDPEYKRILEKPIVELTSEEYEYITRVRSECLSYQEAQDARSSRTAPGTPETGSDQARSVSQPISPYASMTSDYSERRFSISAVAGLAPPTGRMTDYHQSGRSFGAGLDYELSERLAIQLISVGLDHFPIDEAPIRSLGGAPGGPTASEVLPGGSITVVSFVSGIRARPIQWAFAPHIVLGAGIFRASHWDLEMPDGEIIGGGSKTAFGASIGGGFDVPVSQRSTIFTEVRANFAKTGYDSSVYVPVRAGFRYILTSY